MPLCMWGGITFNFVFPCSQIIIIFSCVHWTSVKLLFQSWANFFLGFFLFTWRRQSHPTPVLLPGKSHGWRSLVGYSAQGCKESDTTERLHFTSLFSKRQASYNFMAAVTICSDFGAQENKVCHCFHCFPIDMPWSDGTGCHDLSFLNAEF